MINKQPSTVWPVHLLVLVPLIFVIVSCTSPCGTFTFHDLGVEDTSTLNGWNMDVDFDFDPVACDVECSCNKVCFIQIVRTIDMETGIYLYATTEKQDRATSEGFYLDRLAGRIWGYYGRNDSGTFASTITVGSDTSTATLRDFPKRGETPPWIDFLWMAITVPVCIDNPSSSCNNYLLGYYEWGWVVDDAGTVPYTIDWIAPRGFKDAFDDAVTKWNAQAPGLEKNIFPTFMRLSE